jgi:uncharacterized C2H2 Zn-finger protein
MSDIKIIDFEAESVEEAREKVGSQIPEGFRWFTTQILSDGKPQTIHVSAETIEAAFLKAQNELPADTTVLEKKEISTPGQKTITIEAFEEKNAKSMVMSQCGDAAIIREIGLITTGKKGFLGMGNKPNQYKAEVTIQATVEIIHKKRAKIRVELAPKDYLRCPKCGNLFKEPNTRILPFTLEQRQRIVQIYGEDFKFCPKCNNVFRNSG